MTINHRNFTIERPLKPEITELEHLLELKQYILKWSKQDIEKSHKDSDEERPPRRLLWTQNRNGWIFSARLCMPSEEPSLLKLKPLKPHTNL